MGAPLQHILYELSVYVLGGLGYRLKLKPPLIA